MTEFFEKFNWYEIFKASTVLFAIIDVIGAIPVIIRIQEKSGDISPLRTCIVSFGIMIGFLILGESVLQLFGVDIRSFAVAGAIILFALAIEMIMGLHLFRDEVSGKTASIVPLAFPIIVGAGTMTALISLKAEFHEINIVIAIIINIIIVYLVLKSTKFLQNFLGVGGIAILKKVFGIILLAIAVKLFSSNISALFGSFE